MGAPLTSGGSVALPAVQYGLANASGSVEVPVYGGSVDVQRMYQSYQQAAPTISTNYSPVQVGASGVMTPEQLKFVFPHGAPANYAPAPPSATVIETQGASTVVETAPQAAPEPPVSATVSSKKKDKKSSKKKDKLSSKKKAK